MGVICLQSSSEAASITGVHQNSLRQIKTTLNLCGAQAVNRKNPMKIVNSLGPPGPATAEGAAPRMNPLWGLEP
jgi:hypothetical protein